MKTVGLSKHECVKNLRLYRDKLEKILSLVEGGLPLSGADTEKVQSLLKELKQDLESALARDSARRGKEKMSSIEQGFYKSALHEAAKRISVEEDSIPSPGWIDEIDTAQKHIKYYLNKLLS